MRILKEIHLKTKGDNKIIYFGIPDNPQELGEMFKLRYEIYSKLGYISKELFPKKIEQDQYDIDKKCDYFIAKFNNRIIGSARLIKDYYLPTEKECFKFKEPPEIKIISREKRGEIGRLIVKNTESLPPHLVLLGILDLILSISLKKNLEGGYSFIKESLRKKLKKIDVPFHDIKFYTQIYSKKHLWGYFHNTKDPALPIYYLRKEGKEYLKKIFNNKKIFKKINDNKFLYLLNKSWKFIFYIKISSLFR